MAIRLTESRLRQIIREEMNTLAKSRTAVKRNLRESFDDDYDDDDDYELYGEVAMVDVTVPASGPMAARLARGGQRDAFNLLNMLGGGAESLKAALARLGRDAVKIESKAAGPGEVVVTFYSSMPRDIKTITAAARADGLDVVEYGYAD